MSSISRTSYHVFLSFRGEDTRATFTDLLCTSLRDAGFHTFRDDDNIPRGENIMSELTKAITQSRISIVVLSENYATSGWCLQELCMIVDRYKKNGLLILPLFYLVESNHFTKVDGEVAETFAHHEQKMMRLEKEEDVREGLEKVNCWRAALKEVVEMGGGMLLKKLGIGPESKFIEKIVRVIADKISRTALDGVPHLIGMDYRVHGINLWLQNTASEERICVLCGMGGIGKTTIAKFVYNLNTRYFDGSSFLANVREIMKEHNGLIRLQKQFLSDILGRKPGTISREHEGITKIRDALSDKKFLLVLDDLDQVDQWSDILGMTNFFAQGSRIIITTRHEQLLNSNQTHKVYKVENLDVIESVVLLSWYAFGQDHPIDHYSEQSQQLVNLCQGLPLALRVLGCSLSGKPLDVWNSFLKKLEVIPENLILDKLKLSYESLQDDHDRSLFLDIACFFEGINLDASVQILDDCDFFAHVGIKNLIDRSLLMVDDRNKLAMHHMIRDMGRGIVRKESHKDPGKRSRLWHFKDSLKVLTEKSGTGIVEGITLDMLMLMGENLTIDTGAVDLNKPVNRPFLSINLFHGGGDRLKTSNKLDMDTFARMQNIRLLKLNHVHFNGSSKSFPRRLRWLRWHWCQLKSIPNSYPLESLVVMDMRYSSLKRMWKGTKLLSSLKILNLSHSWSLTKTPNFSELPKLEKLILKDCISLVKIHDSIGLLERLLVLNLKECKKLGRLPRTIGKLTSLVMLDISCCTSLRWFPDEFRMLDSLKQLKADGIAMSEILLTTEDNQRKYAFFFSLVPKYRSSSLTSWAPLPFTLVSLSLVGCNLTDDSFSADFRYLPMLQDLDISENSIDSLPESIKFLPRLQNLSVVSCQRLKFLTGLPNVKTLFIGHCTSLKMITYRSRLTEMPIISHELDNNNLISVQEVFKLMNIEDIDNKMLQYLGLDLESLRDTKVKLRHFTSEKKKRLPLQVLFERGVSSIFLPGNKIPSWFIQGTTSYVSFTISPTVTIGCINIGVVYSTPAEVTISKDQKYYQPTYWKASQTVVHNLTKDLKWVHHPTIFGFPEGNEDMTWLSQWKFGNVLGGGDEVTISVSLTYGLEFKRLGLQLLDSNEHYEPLRCEDSSQQQPFFCHDIVPGDVSKRGSKYKLPTWAGSV